MQTRIWNRDVIKYIAMFTMLLNHVATIFLVPGSMMWLILVNIGYFTAIIMCYFLVEGYDYTHSKRDYGFRLVIFAVLSEVPFCLAFSEGKKIEFYGLNMIFTLLLCFLIVLVIDKVQNKLIRIICIVVLTGVSLWSDWALLAPLFTLMFVWAKGSAKKNKIAFIVAMLLFGFLNYGGGIENSSVFTNLMYSIGSTFGIALAGICILYLYNGKRMEKGRTFSKWFFYLFYPLHLLVLGIIRIAII